MFIADKLSHAPNEQLSTKVGHNTIRDKWQYRSTAYTTGLTTPSDQQVHKVAHPEPGVENLRHPSPSVDNGDSEALSMTTIYSVGAVVIVLLCVVLALLLKGLVEYLISFYSKVTAATNIKDFIYNITQYHTILYHI